MPAPRRTRADGERTREAIVRAAEQYDDHEPLNIGAGREISIRDLVTTICRLMNFTGHIRWDPTKPDGQPRRMLDTSRARQALGFEASMPMEEGLRRTIDWYLQHRPAPAHAARAR